MFGQDYFAPYEQRYGLPSGYLRRTAQIESGLNPRAQNPRSSAGGLFQFIDSTARQYGLSDRFDPVAATDAAARLARDNAAYLRRHLGREPTAAELYMAHQQGADGAVQLLRNSDTSATSLVGSDAVTLNSGSSGMTGGQFAQRILDYYGGPGGEYSGTAAASPTAPEAPSNVLAQMPTMSPQDQNALAQYLGLNRQEPRNVMAEMGWRSPELDPEAFMSRRRFG